MNKNAVVIHHRDNVATALIPLENGRDAAMFVNDEENTISLRDDIQFGHKFAIRDIKKHDEVYKYGESIGRATTDIRAGEHVHVHNVESERGRGDWNE